MSTIDPTILFQPLFVVPGKGIKKEIPSLPSLFHRSVDNIGSEAKRLAALGLGGVVLFGVGSPKSPRGDAFFSPSSPVHRALKELKEAAPSLKVLTDLCICHYTDHGQCGLLNNSLVDNDASKTRICELASSLARAGADTLMPSAMLDGLVSGLKESLRAQGHKKVTIVSQAVKYASALYGPFRAAANFNLKGFGKETYQIDPSNSQEGVREALLDIEEGADAVMVKPALGFLDLITRVKNKTTSPLFAFSTSGEYGMICAGAENGLFRKVDALREGYLSMVRAGASKIVSYGAAEFIEGPSK